MNKPSCIVNAIAPTTWTGQEHYCVNYILPTSPLVCFFELSSAWFGKQQMVYFITTCSCALLYQPCKQFIKAPYNQLYCKKHQSCQEIHQPVEGSIAWWYTLCTNGFSSGHHGTANYLLSVSSSLAKCIHLMAMRINPLKALQHKLHLAAKGMILPWNAHSILLFFNHVFVIVFQEDFLELVVKSLVDYGLL